MTAPKPRAAPERARIELPHDGHILLYAGPFPAAYVEAFDSDVGTSRIVVESPSACRGVAAYLVRAAEWIESLDRAAIYLARQGKRE
ncbi:hypothetical protein LCGC14_3074970 [marine sediment metagenome]|uniref:Uncharacterized protein n=1 Tax=marine sediment metagenome TaxID=412755 RepID=A0A0F8WF12_9ZZZZ